MVSYMGSNHDQNRVLMISMRKLKHHVSRASIYEFEDIICGCDSVDMLELQYNPTRFKITNHLASRAVQTFGGGTIIPSLIGKTYEIKKNYELLFLFCQTPQDLLTLNSVKNWRKRCQIAVCWLDEIWLKNIDTWRNNIQLLQSFDFVFMNFESSISRVSEFINKPCHPIAYGVDALKFAYPQAASRCIDVMSVGRRSTITHEALLSLANQNKVFYTYDTIKGLYMNDHRSHRSLYSNFVKRSQFMMVNKAKFDLLGQTNPQEEIGPRFFEGAAGGAIMIGTAPNCDVFKRHFDWDDAVIEIPFDCPQIGDVLDDLNAQPDRLNAIRRNSIANSLLRHDWSYRWEAILNTCGLEAQPNLLERKADLASLSDTVSSWFTEYPTALAA